MPKLGSKTTDDLGRKVLYPEVSVELCTGDDLLTADKAKELLRWQELEVKKGATFTDRNGKPVRCNAVGLRQRLFTPSLARQWMCEILGRPGQGINPETNLGGNWQLTGETIVIGRTGLCIEGQHRLVGLIWAVQEWAKEPDKFPAWQEEPAINALIVKGISEAPEVVNVMNTGKPRSLADAIVACGLFGDVDPKSLRVLSRMADYAVRLL